MSKNKKCSKNKILNPKTGRCVLRSGKLGKEIIKSKIDFNDISKYISKDMSKDANTFFSNVKCNNFDKSYKKYMSKVLGQGSYGKVYEYCIPKNQKKDCTYALKVINNVPQNEFIDELKIGQVSSDKGIGPKIYKGILCKNIGLIFMDKLQGNDFVNYLYKNYKNITEVKKVIDRVFKKISDFHKLGYVHLDTHGGNIWVNQDNSVYILDYGFSKKSNNLYEKIYDYWMFISDILDDFDDLHVINYYETYIQNKIVKYIKTEIC